jgi:hypothetical protein
MSAMRVTPDRLFEYLDGQRLSVGDADWSVVVYGVIDDEERRWVQVVLDGTRLLVVTLKMSPTDGLDRATQSLEMWLSDPSATDSVLAHVA